MHRFVRLFLVIVLLGVLIPSAEARNAEPLRVLVTGFSDWIDVDSGHMFQCEQNPSCRVLLSEGEEPGLLSSQLLETGEDISWTFLMLPVTWDAYTHIDDIEQYDVVIHLGVDTASSPNVLTIEDGAYNAVRGRDVLGQRAEIESGSVADAVYVSPDSVRHAFGALEALVLDGHSVRVAQARASNAYVCNALHYKTLQTHDAVYFIHLPMTSDADLSALAADLGTLITRILDGYS